jgi:hypothetical protein
LNRDFHAFVTGIPGERLRLTASGYESDCTDAFLGQVGVRVPSDFLTAAFSPGTTSLFSGFASSFDLSTSQQSLLTDCLRHSDGGLSDSLGVWSVGYGGGVASSQTCPAQYGEGAHFEDAGPFHIRYTVTAEPADRGAQPGRHRHRARRGPG